MADNTEDIASVSVSITGDYSPLVDALSQAESKAETGGKEIADALTAGAAGATNIGTVIAEQLEQIVPAAAGAAGAIEGLSNPFAEAMGSGLTLSEAIETLTSEMQPLAAATGEAAAASTGLVAAETEQAAATTEATKATQQSESSLADLAQQLVAVGSALIIVNQIKALGEASLEAADEITRAQIALTVLTGSAETASADIEKLEALGQADGLSMPALLEAAARMQALLGAAAPVPELLSQLANSAAVTGKGIESAANAFDRMATSGSAAARTLLPLGINLQDLAKAFNDLSGTSVATETNVAALFKQLSETERIDVLRDALNKLNGVAAQVKDETFGGQWNSLVAQWSTVLADAGKALLPVIDDLIAFTKTDIVPFLKGAIDAFDSLPGPVKDATVLLGLAATAAVGAAAALGTLGIAIGGLKAAVATISELNLASMLGSTATAAGEATVAVEGLGAAATVTEGAVGGLAIASAAFLVPLVAIVAEIGILVKAYIDMKGAQDQLSDAQGQLKVQTDRLAASLEKHGADLTDLKSKYASGKIDLETYNEALRNMVSSFSGATFSITATAKAIDLAGDSIKKITDDTNTNTIGLNTAIEAYNRINAAYGQHKASATEVAQALAEVNAAFAKLPGSIEPVGLALANQAQKAHEASDAYQTAKGVFETILQAYEQGAPVAAQLAAAQTALAKAEQSAADAGAPIPGTLQAIEIAAQAVTQGITALASSHDIAAAKAQAQSDSLVKLSQDVIVTSEKLVLLQNAEAAVQKQVDAGTASEAQLDKIRNELITTNTQLQAKEEAYSLAVLRSSDAAIEQTGHVGLLKEALDEANLSLSDAKTKLDAGTISGSQYAAAQKGAADAEMAFNQATADLAGNVGRATDTQSLLNAAYDQAKAKVADVTAAYKTQLASIQDLMGAEKSELDGKIALDQELARQATGLATATDATSVLIVQVAQAKAKVDDLTDAVHNNVPVQNELIQAEKTLTDLQNQLNSAMGQAPAPIEAATVAMDAQTQSAIRDREAVASLGSEIKSLSNDFLNLGTAKSAGLSLNAPDGYTLSSSYVGDRLVISYIPTPQTTLSQLQSLGSSESQYADALAKLLGVAPANAPTSTAAGSGTIAAASTGLAGTLDTAAVGGTYPGVVIHQASGEVLLVAIASGGTSTGIVAASGGTSDAATAALAASSTAGAVQSAAAVMSNVVGDLTSLTSAIGAVSGQVAQVAALVSKNVPGAQITLPPAAGTVSSSPLPGVNVGGGINVTGTPSIVSISPNPTAIPNPHPTADSGGNSTTVMADFSGANFSNADPAAVQQAVADGLTRALRDAGARY